MELAYEYTRQRKNFGNHPDFEDTSPAILASVEPDATLKEKWVDRHTTSVELDCIPGQSSHWVNTERFIQEHRGMTHAEGGWPREINTKEFQDKQRYLRRVENEPTYQGSVRDLAYSAERAVMQNNAIDVFEEYFSELPDQDHAREPPSAKTLTVFRDPCKQNRSVSKICWHPEGPNKLAAAYSILAFQKMDADTPVASYIWDVNNPNTPDQELLPSSPLCTLVYNTKSSDHLVGGCYNGLVSFWDLRKGSAPVATSQIEQSHNDPVYDISWIQSRTGNECCSVSTDGQILWWDVRKLADGPTDSMLLQQDDQSTVFGGCSLGYRSDAGATRFLVGSEQGQILSLERKAKKDFESQKSIRSIYGAETGRHHGPIYTVERNPFNVKYMLSVGDWTARVWMEDLKSPILSTRYDGSYLTAGCWSPTRPGVFFTTKMDGTLDVWDLYYRHNAPVFPTKIGEAGLSSVAVQNQGRLVAVGAMDGAITLLSLSDSLALQQPSEKQVVTAMLERETKREKNLEVRATQLARERKEILRQKSFGSETPTNLDSPRKTPRPASAAPILGFSPMRADQAKKTEEEFFETVRKAKEARDQKNAKLAQSHANKDDEAPETGELSPRDGESGSYSAEEYEGQDDTEPGVNKDDNENDVKHDDEDDNEEVPTTTTTTEEVVDENKRTQADEYSFTVHVIKAEGLRDTDFSGKSDPYVKVAQSADGDDSQQTKVNDDAVTPTWNETFDFTHKPDTDQKLFFSIMDEDVGSDDTMGKAEVDIAQYADGDSAEFWVELTHDDKPHGRLQIRISYPPSEPSSSEDTTQPGASS